MSMKKESPSDVQLHLAALQGDVLLLRKVLDSGKVHVDSRDKDGTTPLILAAASGHMDCVQELLIQGADPKARRVTGTTALFFAAQGGFLDIAQVLMDSGASVDSPSVDGGTPLFVACQCGHMDVVKELLDRGAKVNTHMKDRATPLFIASQNGHFKILMFLLAQGATPDSRRTDGATPVWIAAQMGHDHIVRQLLKVGANVDATRHDGATALFKASHKGHSSVIEELLKYKPTLGLLPAGNSRSYSYSEDGEVCIQLDKPCDEITQFLDKAQQVYFAIDSIRRNTDEIKRLHSIILSLPHGKEQNNSEVEDRKTAVCHTIRQIQKQLKEIEIDVMDDEDELESTLSRIRKIQLSTMVRKSAEATREYNETLIKHQERCKAIMYQQLKILDKTAAHDELETLLEKDGGHLFVDNIIADTLEAQLALANVKARHEDILKIESSVREIRDLFAEMAALVETQGDDMSRIEFHVQKASEFADKGQSNLEKARKKQKRARKRNRILLIILITLLGIAVILLLIS